MTRESDRDEAGVFDFSSAGKAESPDETHRRTAERTSPPESMTTRLDSTRARSQHPHLTMM